MKGGVSRSGVSTRVFVISSSDDLHEHSAKGCVFLEFKPKPYAILLLPTPCTLNRKPSEANGFSLQDRDGCSACRTD